MATRNKIARNRTRAGSAAAADRVLWPDPWHGFPFPLSKRDETKRSTHTRAICLVFSFDSFPGFDSFGFRRNASCPRPRILYTQGWAGREIGEGRWRRLEVRLCAAIGRRGEDARVKLVSGAKAGGWFSGLTPVYNSRTAPSGWNPPRTFHPEAIHHPLLLTPPTPRETLTRSINHLPDPFPPPSLLALPDLQAGAVCEVNYRRIIAPYMPAELINEPESTWKSVVLSFVSSSGTRTIVCPLITVQKERERGREGSLLARLCPILEQVSAYRFFNSQLKITPHSSADNGRG